MKQFQTESCVCHVVSRIGFYSNTKTLETSRLYDNNINKCMVFGPFIFGTFTENTISEERAINRTRNLIARRRVLIFIFSLKIDAI